MQCGMPSGDDEGSSAHGIDLAIGSSDSESGLCRFPLSSQETSAASGALASSNQSCSAPNHHTWHVQLPSHDSKVDGLSGSVPADSASEDALRDHASVSTGYQLSRSGFEPITVLPGRCNAINADINSMLDEFENQLPDIGASSLPQAGSFPLFRRIYSERAGCMLVEGVDTEAGTDLFHFVCGACWRCFVEARSVERRVGVIFLVFLLYNSQPKAQDCRIPVDVLLLEMLAGFRTECEQRGVALDCVQILHTLAHAEALSVGVRGTYRSLHFNQAGLLVERRASSLAGPCETRVWARRLRVAASRSAPAPSLSHDEGPVIDLRSAIEDVGTYESQLSDCAVSDKLVGICRAAELYQRSTPPELRTCGLQIQASGRQNCSRKASQSQLLGLEHALKRKKPNASCAAQSDVSMSGSE